MGVLTQNGFASLISDKWNSSPSMLRTTPSNNVANSFSKSMISEGWLLLVTWIAGHGEVYLDDTKTLSSSPRYQGPWHSRVDVDIILNSLVPQAKGDRQFAEWLHCCIIYCLWHNVRWWKVIHVFTSVRQELSTSCWNISTRVRQHLNITWSI